MDGKNNRIFLVSCVTILICLVLLLSTLYSMYVGGNNFVNHLSSGDLEVTLIRTELTGKVYGSDGLMHDYSNTEHVDFSNPTERNLFDLTEETYFVPGMEYKASLAVENNSDVVFGYYVEILVSDDSSEALCQQLEVVISSGDRQVSGKLSDLLLGSANDYLAIVELGGSSSFTVEISFIDDSSVNNDVMDEKVYFDLVVHANQITSSQNSSNN